jgi:cysteine synthase
VIDLTIHEAPLERAIERARARGIIIPTLAEMRDHSLVESTVVDDLSDVGLSDLDARNLFRITWHNEPTEHGGGFGGVNYIEFPPKLTGVDARIIALVGKWFPTGTHKVGAAFGCLVPRLVTGQYDPTSQAAVWPSTGNYCRGGAYDSRLLGCESIAILPEGMSRERFEWLEMTAGEVITTPGSESNVKEIFDKCAELATSGRDLVILNQFDDLGNYMWHYGVTGPAMAEVLEETMQDRDVFRAVVLTTGSAGTIASGDYLKQRYPDAKIVAGEALQCPTMLNNGYGTHRIEGIGDKHIPWIYNVKNTDVVVAIDDESPISLIRLFNEPAGVDYLAKRGVSAATIERLPDLGISSVANLLGAIKFARSNNLGSDDVILTVATDSIDMYRSRLTELVAERGPYNERVAARDFQQHLIGQTTEHMLDLTAEEQRRIHNLKYFTWIEQQGKQIEELDAQWDDPDYWTGVQGCIEPVDELIRAFNERVAAS